MTEVFLRSATQLQPPDDGRSRQAIFSQTLRGCENIERRSETVSRRSRQGALREKQGSLVS
jgi:hypothetical protein